MTICAALGETPTDSNKPLLKNIPIEQGASNTVLDIKLHLESGQFADVQNRTQVDALFPAQHQTAQQCNEQKKEVLIFFFIAE